MENIENIENISVMKPYEKMKLKAQCLGVKMPFEMWYNESNNCAMLFILNKDDIIISKEYTRIAIQSNMNLKGKQIIIQGNTEVVILENQTTSYINCIIKGNIVFNNTEALCKMLKSLLNNTRDELKNHSNNVITIVSNLNKINNIAYNCTQDYRCEVLRNNINYTLHCIISDYLFDWNDIYQTIDTLMEII